MVRPICIVYYVYLNHPENWKGIVHGQINDLVVSGLLKISDLCVCLSGEISLMEEVNGFIHACVCSVKDSNVTYTMTEENLYEYPGIHQLYVLAKTDPNRVFLYMHTKGMSRSTSPTERSLDNICLTRLTAWNHVKIMSIFENYPAINKIGLFPSSAGWIWFNFFWVRGSYLVKCNEPIVSNRRHAYEDWLGTSNHKSSLDSYSIYDNLHGSSYIPAQACSLLRGLFTVNYGVINSHITRVVYGVEQHYVDITQHFIELLNVNKWFTIRNELTGCDPCYGVVKQLIIYMGDGHEIQVVEGTHIHFAYNPLKL
jgi:hypothetical protein